MVRSALAVLIGYVLIAALVVTSDMIAGALFPDWFVDPATGQEPPLNGILLNFVYALPWAAVGGFVTALLAHREEMKHVYALVILNILFGIMSFFSFSEFFPWWYFAVIMLFGIVGPIVGGRLFLQRAGGTVEG